MSGWHFCFLLPGIFASRLLRARKGGRLNAQADAMWHITFAMHCTWDAIRAAVFGACLVATTLSANYRSVAIPCSFAFIGSAATACYAMNNEMRMKSYMNLQIASNCVQLFSFHAASKKIPSPRDREAHFLSN